MPVSPAPPRDTSTNASWSWLSAWRSGGLGLAQPRPQGLDHRGECVDGDAGVVEPGLGLGEVQGGELVELQRLLAHHQPGRGGQQLLAGGLDLEGVLLGGRPFLGRQLAIGPVHAGRRAGSAGLRGAGVVGRRSGTSSVARARTVDRMLARRSPEAAHAGSTLAASRPTVHRVVVDTQRVTGTLHRTTSGKRGRPGRRSGVCAPTRPRFVRPGSIGRSGAARRGRRLPPASVRRFSPGERVPG